MLGKIIKHEFKATYKTALTMILSVLLVGGLVRMMDMVSFDGTIWRIIEMIMAVFYLLLLIAVPVSMFVVSIARFYRTMVKDEGYLKTEDYSKWLNQDGYLDCLVNYPYANAKEIEKLRDRLMSRYYFSFTYIFKTFLANLSWVEFKRVMKAGFTYIAFRIKKIGK